MTSIGKGDRKAVLRVDLENSRRRLLKDRMAVITGSGEGLGEQVARVFCREGADVVLASSEGAAATGQGINAKERKAANA